MKYYKELMLLKTNKNLIRLLIQRHTGVSPIGYTDTCHFSNL